MPRRPRPTSDRAAIVKAVMAAYRAPSVRTVRLLQTWPYGPRRVQRLFTGHLVRLDAVARDPLLNDRPTSVGRLSREALIASIFRDVAWAMWYVTGAHDDRAWDHQAIDAHAMVPILHQGLTRTMPWSELAAMSRKDLRALAVADERAYDRASRAAGCMGRASRGVRVVALQAPDHPSRIRNRLAIWRVHGRRVVVVPPLTDMGVRELRAVAVVVGNMFENMC